MERSEFKTVIQILRDRYKPARPEHVSRPDPFQVLVGAMLSHRTRDEKTDAAFNRLFKELPDINSVAGASLRRIERLVRDVGFYRVKSRRIREVARILAARYAGLVPDDREALMELPGVGPKTADIVLSMAFGRPELAVDTHVETVAKRLGVAGEDAGYEEVKKAIQSLADTEDIPVINGLLVSFGREICRRPRPRCGVCPVRGHCRYYRRLVG